MLPQHLGIIMDGNGRWAKARGLSRNEGHVEGLKRAKEITLACLSKGIPYLSLYVFSTENWRRTEKEVNYLMSLIRQYMKKELHFYKDNKLRVIHSGDLSALPEDIQKDVTDVEEATSGFVGLTVNLLLNYGGRNEIQRAAELSRKHGTDGVDLSAFLDHPELPDVDLVIRTANERRLSNFMLWKCAYAELYFTPVPWPDFYENELDAALEDYQKRVRNYGGGGE